MTDMIVGLIVVFIFGMALFYIRREKKKGVVSIGCPHAGTCGKKHCGCHTEQ